MQPLILSFFFISSIFVLLTSNLNRHKQNILYAIIGIGLILVAGFRLESSVRDYHVYVNMYNSVKAGSFVLTDISFKWITMLSSTSLMLFVVYAILGVSIKLYAIKTIGTTLGLSLLIYISNFFILHEMTQMRAGVASGILLLSVKYIYDRNLIRFLLCAIIASLFHASALIMIPLWFLNPQKKNLYLLSLLPLVGLVFALLKISLFVIIPIPFIQEKLEQYQMLTKLGVAGLDNINIFNLVFLAKVGIYYLLLSKYDLAAKHNKYFHVLMYIWAISLCSFWIFSTIPVLSFRISELYGIIEVCTIPFLTYILKPSYLSAVVIVIIAAINIIVNISFNSLIS